jgi:hypothetical protein
MIRSGTYVALRNVGWYPVVAAQTDQFYRGLLPFERFIIDTRLVRWGRADITHPSQHPRGSRS